MQLLDVSLNTKKSNMIKRNINVLKLQNFIQKYPYILFFQHNNLSVKQWDQLRQELKNLKTTDLILIKNTYIQTLFCENAFFDTKKLAKIFQGPCFAVGFSQQTQFKEINQKIHKFSSILLLAALFDKKLLTHLEVSKFITLDERIYSSLLGKLNQSNAFVNILENSLDFNILHSTVLRLLYFLEIIKTKRLFLYINNKKESIQPQVPLRLPCYDFAPVTDHIMVP